MSSPKPLMSKVVRIIQTVQIPLGVTLPMTIGRYRKDGSRIIELGRLGQIVETIANHNASCANASIRFLGESYRYGLASKLVFQCCKCTKKFRLESSTKVTVGKSSHYAVNVGAVLGQISTGGGSAHLNEQMANVGVPALSKKTFTRIERELGKEMEEEVTCELLKAGDEERALATEYSDGVPAISVVVDAGWSKRSHKHSFNANSGVGVIFGATTKKLLHLGVRNKYCSICSVASRKGVEPRQHECFRNWSGSSCAMEADIITEGFRKSEAIHRLRYLYLVGDGDSSVFHSVAVNVPYGRYVKKVECCNHAVKCYRTRLEAIVKDNPRMGGRGGLTKAMIVRIATGARSAIRYHSKTLDVAALRHDLRNGPRHCFGDHSNCRANGFCRHVTQDQPIGKTDTITSL